MKPVPPGLAHRHEIVPDASHTAAAVGNAGVVVVGTPFLIGYFEIAAHRAILPFCEPGEVTVGTRIEVDHLKAAPVGAAVYASARLISQEGRFLTFEVEAGMGDTLIGRGRVYRAIVEPKSFSSKASARSSS